MKTFIVIFLALLLAGSRSNAQGTPGWGWAHHLGAATNAQGDNGVAGLGRDAAGNLYLLGHYVGMPAFNGTATTNAGETAVFLAKYSPAGALLWLRTLQSTGFDVASALVVEPSGRCTLAGTFGGVTGDNCSFASFGTPFLLAGPALLGLPRTNGQYQGVPFIAAVDAAGGLLWADTPSPTYGLGVVALHRDNLGSTYLSSNTVPQSLLTVNGQSYPPMGSSDAVLIKYSVMGQPEWARRIGANGGFTYMQQILYTGMLTIAVHWLWTAAQCHSSRLLTQFPKEAIPYSKSQLPTC